VLDANDWAGSALTDALISEEVSVQITNITLEYDESKPASEKRSVIKMQYLTAHPQLLEAAAMAQRDGGESDDEFDEGDSEIDSDEFGGSDDDDDEEGGELDDELMADLSKVSKASGASSSSKKAGKVNGDLSAELEGEDDDDEDDDEEDSDDDSDYEREEAEVQICSLLPGKVGRSMPKHGCIPPTNLSPPPSPFSLRCRSSNSQPTSFYPEMKISSSSSAVTTRSTSLDTTSCNHSPTSAALAGITIRISTMILNLTRMI
jgi:hypothetical protein